MIIALSLSLLFLSAAVLTWGLMPDASKRLIRRRVYRVVATENRYTWLAQLADVLAPINRHLPTGRYHLHIQRRLDAAGIRRLPTIQFFVMQEMGALAGLLVYFITLGSGRLNPAWLGFWVLLGCSIPYIALNNRVAERRLTVSRDLPEVVDLLSLCVDAGIDFMNSLGRIVKEFRQCPVTDELDVVIQEVRVGKRRRDALRAFAARVQTPETTSFSRTLVQADRMGTGIAEALQVLSEDMRIMRYHWAERFAQQAPLKMMVPLLMSLAAALIIVAGPILLQFLRGDWSKGGFDRGALGFSGAPGGGSEAEAPPGPEPGAPYHEAPPGPEPLE